MSTRPSGRGRQPRPSSITKITTVATAEAVRVRPLPARRERRGARRAAERRDAANLMADDMALIESGLVQVSIDDGGELRYRFAYEE